MSEQHLSLRKFDRVREPPQLRGTADGVRPLTVNSTIPHASRFNIYRTDPVGLALNLVLNHMRHRDVIDFEPITEIEEWRVLEGRARRGHDANRE